MRERERCGRGSTMKVVVMVMVVIVMMVTGVVKVAEATPAVTSSLHHHHHHHEEAAGPTSMQANHVEDTYLDDALDDWLNNFETYTFMVKQDLDSHHDEEEAEGGEEEEVEAGTEEQEEVDEEEEQHVKEEEWSAPIAVSVGSKSLLDPHLDYLVTVESLVAEEGSIFLTLSKYKNQTECGVGGFTVEAAMRSPLPPRRAVARGESNSGGGSIEEQRNASTTFIAFDLQYEGNMSLPDTSAWAEVSEDYWWARGRLAGGGMLSITFTPPECGCLSLSTYYALPVGNLTLVVGPQAYPEELQVLLCIDPLAVAPVQEEYDEEEEEEEEEEGDVGEYLQEPSALVAPRTTEAGVTEVEEEGDAETSPDEQPPVVTPRRRKGPRGERRKAKKNRRQMKRQRIRQAGRRQARRQQRQQQRQEEDEDEEEGEEGAPGVKRGRRRWKQKRRGKKVWRKIKKGRKGRRRYHGAKHHLHHDDDENENTTDHHHHHHPHPHAIHGQNTSAATQQEERLIDILLRDTPTENSTEAEQHEEDAPVGDGSGNGEAAVETEEQEGAEDDEAAMTPRQRRKNRRQRKKMMRKERKKAHPPGIKFCCKQGVKHKKNILEFNSTSESSPAPCNSTSEVVSTFANHQFGIEVDACDHTYSKCCTGFTAEMWNSIKAKKMARRMERKQRRKTRRQGRKHRRQNERRIRKEMKRQSRHHEEAEEEAEAGQEEHGEGEAVVE